MDATTPPPPSHASGCVGGHPAVEFCRDVFGVTLPDPAPEVPHTSFHDAEGMFWIVMGPTEGGWLCEPTTPGASSKVFTTEEVEAAWA